jgi:dethiobiotin synthetase
LNRQQLKTGGMKPVASGATSDVGQLQNEDALKLMAAASLQLTYEQVNPYLFKVAASPHIAAALEQQQVSLDRIVACYRAIEKQADFVVVEGVGGWLAPLNEQQTVEHMALALDIPVLLVVGMHLGCLNHALLTAQRIQQAGLKLAGWIANCLDNNFPYLEENISTLEQRIDAPLVARLNENQTDFAEKYEKSISLLVKTK